MGFLEKLKEMIPYLPKIGKRLALCGKWRTIYWGLFVCEWLLFVDSIRYYILERYKLHVFDYVCEMTSLQGF